MDTASGTLTKYKMFIGGEWVAAAGGEYFPSDNPYTGKPWASIPRGGAADVARAVEAAHQALTTGDWPKLNATKRGALLRKLGDLAMQSGDTTKAREWYEEALHITRTLSATPTSSTTTSSTP